MPTTRPVPPRSLDDALGHIAKGGRLVVRTAWRATVLDRKVLRRFEQAGAWLIREDGDGYRLRNGKGSVHLLPGQLEYVIED
ncbi:MAG: hypothetical protein WAP03_29915 [Methylorubrum rhodinum]|uniref:hypothetical protein n=1 Tax=Methylorubrum rhodinum TaxID=29428 RepID=UPI003BAFD42B